MHYQHTHARPHAMLPAELITSQAGLHVPELPGGPGGPISPLGPERKMKMKIKYKIRDCSSGRSCSYVTRFVTLRDRDSLFFLLGERREGPSNCNCSISHRACANYVSMCRALSFETLLSQ